MRNKRGMTLVELLIALSIFLLLYNLIFSVYFSLQKQYNRIIEENEVSENLTLAIEQMEKDILNSRGVSRCRSDSVELLEGIIYRLREDPQKGTHLYSSLRGSVLYRQEAGKTNQPIANFLHKLHIRYFDAAGNECANCSQITTLEIELTAKVGKKQLVKKAVLSLGTGGQIYG